MIFDSRDHAPIPAFLRLSDPEKQVFVYNEQLALLRHWQAWLNMATPRERGHELRPKNYCQTSGPALSHQYNHYINSNETTGSRIRVKSERPGEMKFGMRG